MPTVSDLSHKVEGNEVYLEWTVPAEFGRGEAIVSRARTELGDEMCDNCPLAYRRIAVLPIHPQHSSLTQRHRELLSSGFRYTYRVVLETNNGRTSAASNLVTFDY